MFYNIYGKNIDIDFVLSIEVLGWFSCVNFWGDFVINRIWFFKFVVEEIKIMGIFYFVLKFCLVEVVNLKFYWCILFFEVEKKLLRFVCVEKKKSYCIVKVIFEVC